MAFTLAAAPRSLQAPPRPRPPPRCARSLTVTVTDEKGAARRRPRRPTTSRVARERRRRDVARVERDTRPLAWSSSSTPARPMRDHYRLNIRSTRSSRFSAGCPRARATRSGRRATGRRRSSTTPTTAAPRRRRCGAPSPRGGNTLLDALVEASEDLARPRRRPSAAIVVIDGSGHRLRELQHRQQVVDDVRRGQADRPRRPDRRGGDAASRSQGEVSRPTTTTCSTTWRTSSGRPARHPCSPPWALDATLRQAVREPASQYRLRLRRACPTSRTRTARSR